MCQLTYYCSPTKLPLRNDMEALEGENRSLTLVLRAKTEQLENALRQLEHVEEALGEAVQDGVCVCVCVCVYHKP